jgi:PhnB protein
MAKSIPDGYHSVTPYLILKGAAAAIDFYKRAFGATELMRMASPDGRIGHAEMKIGDSAIMLADEHPAMGYRSPQSLGGAGVSLMVYVERVDDVFRKAVAAGAKELQPVKDQFYGDRSGTLQDPFGHTWTIATHMEDIPPEEMRRRAEKFMQQQKAGVAMAASPAPWLHGRSSCCFMNFSRNSRNFSTVSEVA